MVCPKNIKNICREQETKVSLIHKGKSLKYHKITRILKLTLKKYYKSCSISYYSLKVLKGSLTNRSTDAQDSC